MKINKKEILSNGHTKLSYCLSENQIELIKSDIFKIFNSDIVKDYLWIDEYDCDHRIFGFENLSSTVNGLKKDLDLYMEEMYGCSTDSTILAQKVLPSPNNQGSGGQWHRDSIRTQYKAFIYLNNTDLQSGCLDVGENTFKAQSKIKEFISTPNLFKIKVGSGASQPKRIHNIIANKGDIFLVNTSAIHRGHPGLQKERINLTLYSYKKHKMPEQIKSKIFN